MVVAHGASSTAQAACCVSLIKQISKLRRNFNRSIELQDPSMAKFGCTVCNYVYDEARENRKFSDLLPSVECQARASTERAHSYYSEYSTLCL
jgi:hypothetical protein